MERLIRLSLTIALSCVIGLAGTAWVYGVEKEEEDSPGTLYARSAVLADGTTGRVLWGKNENEPMAMASTTKIMTCLVALENSAPDEQVSISEYAASMPDVQLDAVAGDTFRMEDLLYSLMLESHNDTAVAIAEHIGGSVEEFAQMMNQRAEEMGCMQTNFVTPNGLDSQGHYTTAAELALIASEAIKNEDFLKIINTGSYSFSNVDGTRQYHVENKNAFLNMMPGAFGIKIGFTNDAGYCFVGALESDERVYISVVLGSGWPPNKNYKWQDTMKLMNFGLEHYVLKEIGSDALDVGELKIDGGCEDTVRLTTDAHSMNILMKESDIFSSKIVRDLERKAPIDANERVGWLYYEINGEIIEQFSIYITDAVEKRNFAFCLQKLVYWWMYL